MPSTHTWKPTNSGFIYNPTNYADGAAFAPGDTLVISGGRPNSQRSNDNVEAFTTGNHQFTPTGASSGATFNDMSIDAASTLSVVGPQLLSWKTTGQFFNSGTFQIGSAAGSGNVQFTIYDKHFNQPAAVTNTGSMVLQNGSRFETNVILDNNDVFLNTAGAVLSINSGSVFDDGPRGTSTRRSSPTTA